VSSREAPTLEWKSDTEFVLAGVSYVCLELPAERLMQDRFRILKPRWQVERYEQIIDEANPKNIFELGIWEGGSTALLAQLAQPSKLVAVDRKPNPSAVLERFLDQRDLRVSVKTYYGIDQADATHLSEVLDREFGDESLDLVIDDASHLLDETRRSFNVLFPRLAPGGMYLIEDWSWAHTGFVFTKDQLRDVTPLSVLLFELVLACAHRPTVVEEIVVKRGLAIVRRGPQHLGSRPFDVTESYGDFGRVLMLGLGNG
jgi:predicted O-methyltransferase YrrM